MNLLTQSEPRTLHLRSLSPHGFHRVVYYEWGDRANPRVVMTALALLLIVTMAGWWLLRPSSPTQLSGPSKTPSQVSGGGIA